MGAVNCKKYATENGTKKSDNGVAAGTNCIGSYQLRSSERSEMTTESYIDPVRVCHVDDVAEGQMRQFDFIDDAKVLVVKRKGQVYGLGSKCTHYGAPLHTGALGDGRIRCPWHGACFNIETGDIEDFPGLDSLPCYKVDVTADGEVKISAKSSTLANAKRLKNMVKRDPDNMQTIVVVGGGPAAGVCIETLRQEGFTGRIVMVCREPYLPYDRVKISKAFDIDIKTIQYRQQEFYDSYDIETYLSVTATGVNCSNKTVDLSNGQQIKYDKMFIATGCTPYRPEIENLEKVKGGVFTVREYEDLLTIRNEINDTKHVVCYGSSFIALEAAQSLVKKVASMTIVARGKYPLETSLGEEIGKRVLQLYQDNQVKMIMESGIKSIIVDDDGMISHLKLNDDSEIPCEMLILGTGTKMNTTFLTDSKIPLNKNGSIDTDEYLRSADDDIYIGGDIANAPVLCNNQERTTIGHYQLAQYHGRMAAVNMVSSLHDRKMQTIAAVPFFFTMLFGKAVRYAGHGRYENVVIDGNLKDLKFIAYYINDEDRVVAVASCGRDPIVAQYAELLSQGLTLTRTDLKGGENSTNWTKLLKTS